MSQLFIEHKLPFKLFEINILDADMKGLLKISQEMGLGLNLEEMMTIQQYFSKKRRNPTDVELQTIGQTWSEHCFHKTFKGEIIFGREQIDGLFNTYIAKATKELKPSWCLSIFEDNAGIIEFDDGYAVAVKVETHNHPSAIEPFGGAATGIGGVIRDILGVWAEPIACMDVLGFGPLDYDYKQLPPGVKHPKYLFKGVVAGIGCYGNNMGIPTVNGAVCFDESYAGNVLVYCGCIGILPWDTFIKNVKPEDVIVLAGGKTGRDGIHGVTFASAELTEKSEEVSRPAVQIANPLEEEKLKRAIIEIRDKKLASAITDLGGGGLSSAVGEMAHKFKCGAYVELDRVPLKYPDMAPWEIYISESQERMLLAVPKNNLPETLKIFAMEDVEATPIGRFTEDGILRIHYRESLVAELDISFLFSPPSIRRRAEWKQPDLKEPSFPEPQNLGEYILKLLSSPSITSKESVVRTYDHEVKGNTALKPLHGEYGGPNDAAVLKPLNHSWKGLVISCGINPKYGKIDPYWMAASCIDEAIRNNVAVGGRRIALLDNFTWGSPEHADRLGALVKACQACYEFSKGFETPFISGKDSLYNESPLGAITPTLLITALGIIPDIRKTVSLDLKTPGDYVYIIGETYPELGGSAYYELMGFLGKSVPKVKVKEAKKTMNAVTDAIDSGFVKACHDLSEGGLAVAAAEMALSSQFGMELYVKKVPYSFWQKRNDFILFSESNSRFLIEIPEKHVNEFKSLMKGVTYAQIGKVTEKQALTIYGLKNKPLLEIGLEELRRFWKSGLED